MRDFKLIDTHKRWMPTMKPSGKVDVEEMKLLFLAEIHYSVPNKGYRVFIAFCDVNSMKFYIEEVLGSQLVYIEDDLLAEDLNYFLDLHQLKTFKAMAPWIEQPMVPYQESAKKIFI